MPEEGDPDRFGLFEEDVVTGHVQGKDMKLNYDRAGTSVYVRFTNRDGEERKAVFSPKELIAQAHNKLYGTDLEPDDIPVIDGESVDEGDSK